jgi:hypothetical protein
VLGVALGLVFEKIARPGVLKRRVVDPSALSLVFVWVGYLLFPFFPMLGLYAPTRKFQLFLQAPLFDFIPLISFAAIWFAAGRLLRGSGLRAVGWWLAAAALIIPTQLFIVSRQPTPSDFIGAIAGLLSFLLLGRTFKPTWREAALFLGVILLRGLEPFHLTATSNPFTFIPFAGFLGTLWQQGLLVLLEKGFFYGTAIWLWRASGFRLWHAVTLVAIVLTAIELAQTRLPGRTAEITDPVLAILLGFGLRVLSRQAD